MNEPGVGADWRKQQPDNGDKEQRGPCRQLPHELPIGWPPHEGPETHASNSLCASVLMPRSGPSCPAGLRAAESRALRTAFELHRFGSTPLAAVRRVAAELPAASRGMESNPANGRVEAAGSVVGCFTGEWIARWRSELYLQPRA